MRDTFVALDFFVSFFVFPNWKTITFSGSWFNLLFMSITNFFMPWPWPSWHFLLTWDSLFSHTILSVTPQSDFLVVSSPTFIIAWLTKSGSFFHWIFTTISCHVILWETFRWENTCQRIRRQWLLDTLKWNSSKTRENEFKKTLLDCIIDRWYCF